MKKIFLLITVVAITLFSTVGCMTKQVWREQTKPHPYNETIMAFYANPKSSELAFIGEQYHYIFKENTKFFTDLLHNKKFLNLKQSHLRIHAFVDREDNRAIHALIDVHYPLKGANSQQLAWLKNHHFTQTEQGYYLQHYSIKGTRYVASKEINKKALKLRSPIHLQIEDYTIEGKSTFYKIAMTPISLTGDAIGGILMLGAVVVMSPVWLYEQITQ